MVDQIIRLRGYRSIHRPSWGYATRMSEPDFEKTDWLSGSGFMAGGTLSSMTIGQDIVVAGLVVQIVSFGLFVTVALSFHARMRKVPTFVITSSNIPWQRHLHTLYMSSALIMIRSIFRVVEFVEGNDGFIFRREWFMYVFDTLLMFFVLVLLCVIHPGEIKGYLGGVKPTDPESRESTGEVVLMQEYSAPARGLK